MASVDYQDAAKRVGPYVPSEPTISCPPTPDEPPSVEETAVKILKELEQLRESAKEKVKNENGNQ